MKTKWTLLSVFLFLSFLNVANAEYYVVYSAFDYTSCEYNSCNRPSCRSACNPPSIGDCARLVPEVRSVYNEDEYQWIDP